MRRSDEQQVAPGSGTLRALFGDAPTLILLDELSVHLRRVGRLDEARGQLTAFLTSLFRAVESTPNADTSQSVLRGAASARWSRGVTPSRWRCCTERGEEECVGSIAM